jgi:chemotaxis protein methyltransferase CheR
MDAQMTPPTDHDQARGSEPVDIELGLLLEAIFHKYHYDFRRYSEASLRRRVRAALAHFGCETISRLQERVLHEPRVFTELLRFLTVQVSELFRDPSYFRSIREKVVPYLQTYPSIKVWVPGCATGEEAYSLAIVLAEEGLLDRTLIYATDISPESLRVAEEGVYDVDRFARFSQSYLLAGGRASLSSYYMARYSSAVVDRSLKQAILFSDHSLATDSAFAEVELVSCRNVLIYFERELQDRAIGVLRDSLCRKGFLGLGLKESLRFSAHAAAFAEFVSEDRIYQRL